MIHMQEHTIRKEKYEIRRVLGSGSFGVTYLAEDLVLQHLIALKEYAPVGKCRRRPDGSLGPAEGCEREFEEGKCSFREEAARIYGMFDLPGICSVLDFFEENGTAYLVEEYLPGGTFRAYLDARRGHVLPFEECRTLFAPVLEGLCQLHARGIIHRDISPDNLMCTGDGQWKLIDFGAATRVGERMGEGSGKIAYAPPELYTQDIGCGPWSDLYAICCVFYEALTGHRPPSAARRLQRDRLRPAASYASIPQKAEAALMQGLSLDIQQRFFSVSGLMEGLGMDTTASQSLLEQTRSLWGADWLQLTTGGGSRILVRTAGRRQRVVKRVLLGCGGMLAALAVLAGGAQIYFSAYPSQRFDLQLARARTEAARHPYQELREGTPEYVSMLRKLAPYERDTGETSEDGRVWYDVPQTLLRKWNFRNVSSPYFSGCFYLDGETVKELLERAMGCRLEAETSSYLASVGTEQADGTGFLFNTSTLRKAYNYTAENGQLYELSLSLDPADERVKTLTVNGTPAVLRTILKEVFPYLVPETYLTDAELDGLLADAVEAFSGQELLEEDESLQTEQSITEHAKFRLKVRTNVRREYAYAQLTLEPGGNTEE